MRKVRSEVARLVLLATCHLLRLTLNQHYPLTTLHSFAMLVDNSIFDVDIATTKTAERLFARNFKGNMDRITDKDRQAKFTG